MKKITIIVAAVAVAFIVTGCPSLFRPEPTTSLTNYRLEFHPESKTNVQIGTQGSQANAIHDKVEVGKAGGELSEVDGQAETARQASLFGNTAISTKSTDADIAAAVEILKEVRGTSAGLSQSTTKGDESPATTGDQSHTPTQTEEKPSTVNIPISVGQAAKSDTGAGVTGAGDAASKE